jgi:hypothetical protein
MLCKSKKCAGFSTQFFPEILSLFLVLIISSSASALPAFPCAEGFGSDRHAVSTQAKNLAKAVVKTSSTKSSSNLPEGSGWCSAIVGLA